MRCADTLGNGLCSYAIYLPWKAKFPWEDESQRQPYCVSIDKCLIHEVVGLWEKGIKTTGCCCGHGRKEMAFIGVDSGSIQAMLDMGYQVWHNPCRPLDSDSFVPKTVLAYGESKNRGEWE